MLNTVILVSSSCGQTWLYDSVCQVLKPKLPCTVLVSWKQHEVQARKPPKLQMAVLLTPEFCSKTK